MTDKPIWDYGLYTADEFLSLPIPPRQPLLGGWLVEGSLTLLYAARGVGKSNFAMGLAVALSRGESFVGFACNAPVPVLYLDGEMPPFEFQRRWKAFGNGQPLANVHLYSAGKARFPIASLSTQEGQDMADRFIHDPDVNPKVVIIDNKSTMMSLGRENDAESWSFTQEWLMHLRNMGIAVILVHHAGKNGLQRGTSLIEATPDIIIKLETPKGDSPASNTSRFILTFEKNRHVVGPELQPKLITLHMTESSATWEYSALEDVDQHIFRLKGEGKNGKEIATILGISESQVSRRLQKREE